MTKQTSASAQAGFTMIELLVALVVTMVALAGLMQLYVTSARANLVSQQSTVATDAAQQSLEDLRGMSVAEIEAQYAPITTSEWDPPIAFHDGDITVKGIVFSRDVIAQEIEPNVVRVSVRIQWSDEGLDVGVSPESDHRVSLETLRGRTTLW